MQVFGCSSVQEGEDTREKVGWTRDGWAKKEMDCRLSKRFAGLLLFNNYFLPLFSPILPGSNRKE
jgi:hypothetical protein